MLANEFFLWPSSPFAIETSGADYVPREGCDQTDRSSNEDSLNFGFHKFLYYFHQALRIKKCESKKISPSGIRLS